MPAIHYYEASHFIGLRIDAGRLEFVSVIGHGAEGEVLLARNVSSAPDDRQLYVDEYYVSHLGHMCPVSTDDKRLCRPSRSYRSWDSSRKLFWACKTRSHCSRAHRATITRTSSSCSMSLTRSPLSISSARTVSAATYSSR